MISNILKIVYITCATIIIFFTFLITFYYSDGENAESSTLINQGQMIEAAITLQNADKDYSIKYINDLTSIYLKEVPMFKNQFWGEPSVEQSEYSIHGSILSDKTCDGLNLKAGLSINEDHSERMTSQNLEGPFGCNSELKAFYKTGDFYKN